MPFALSNGSGNGFGVAVPVGVPVGVDVGVALTVGVMVAVNVGVAVAVMVAVAVGPVGVLVGVNVRVLVGVLVGVGGTPLYVTISARHATEEALLLVEAYVPVAATIRYPARPVKFDLFVAYHVHPVPVPEGPDAVPQACEPKSSSSPCAVAAVLFEVAEVLVPEFDIVWSTGLVPVTPLNSTALKIPAQVPDEPENWTENVSLVVN